MIASQRSLYIIQRIKENGIVNIKEVAKALDISETTVRRDFDRLEKSGKLVRVQGGAKTGDVSEKEREEMQFSSDSKKALCIKEKKQVAKFAASLVEEGETVFVDDGTSLLPILEILMTKNVRIVTNNTLLFSKHFANNATLVFLGGQYNKEHNLVAGEFTKNMLSHFNFDHAFIGCFGINIEKNFVYTTDLESHILKQIAMDNSNRKHLILDHTKFGKNGFLRSVKVTDFDTLICDDMVEIVGEKPESLHICHD